MMANIEKKNNEKQNGVLKSSIGFKSVNIHIIGACNYHCGFCFTKGLSDQFLSKEMWISIFIDLRNRGVEKINFAGGEPFLHPELIEYCKICKELGFTVSIISNASLITEEVLRTVAEYVDWLGISIDSSDNDVEKSLADIAEDAIMWKMQLEFLILHTN